MDEDDIKTSTDFVSTDTIVKAKATESKSH